MYNIILNACTYVFIYICNVKFGKMVQTKWLIQITLGEGYVIHTYTVGTSTFNSMYVC